MIYFLYYLPLDKTRILLNQSLSPHHRSNKVDCYVYIPQFHWYWSYHWHIPIHKYFTYIICIIGPIIGGRVVGVRVAPSTNVFVWMGIKIEFYAYRMSPCLGWMGGARLANKVPPRRLYIYIGQVVRWHATAIFYRWYHARGKRRIFSCHEMMHYVRRSLVSQPRWR